MIRVTGYETRSADYSFFEGNAERKRQAVSEFNGVVDEEGRTIVTPVDGKSPETEHYDVHNTSNIL